MDEKKTLAARVDQWVRRSPPFVGMLLLVVVISSVITISGGASKAWNFYEDKVRWREQEYDKIRQLRGGISIAKVEELLGSALFVRKSADGTLTERSFRGRDFWVQAVHDEIGTVKMIAVTSCDLDFKPRIDSALGTVVLNESTFDAPEDKPDVLRYFLSGATANSFFIDEHKGGNPGLYKTYFIGINDACPWVSNYALTLSEQHTFLQNEVNANPGPVGDGKLPRNMKGSYDPANQHLVDFRSRSVVNTYAETEKQVDPDVIINAFQIGVDRILTRTIDLPEQQ